MIKSGAVFVFSVEESGIKRWTGEIAFITQTASAYDADGLLWSPSRIVGNFLVGSSTFMTPLYADHRWVYCKVYREINERTSSRGSHKKPYPLDSSSRGLSTHRTSPDQTSAAFKGPGHLLQTHGSTDQGTFKLNGLIKKVCSVIHAIVSSAHGVSADNYSDGRGVRPSPDIILHVRGYPVR